MQTIGIEKQLIRFLTNPSFSLCRGDLAENNLYPPEIRLDPIPLRHEVLSFEIQHAVQQFLLEQYTLDILYVCKVLGEKPHRQPLLLGCRITTILTQRKHDRKDFVAK